MEAVRRALGELGKTAMPLQIQKLVEERFGIDMNVNHISTCKGDILRKNAKKAQAKQAAPRPPAPPAPAPPAKVRAGGIGLDDIRTAKELVGRVGADSLRTLIDLLSK